MTYSLGGGIELLVLSALLLGPLAVDLGLLFLALRLAQSGSRMLLTVPVMLYLGLNVVLPLVVIGAVFRDEWVWLLALFLFVKILEFGPMGVGSSFAELWSKRGGGHGRGESPGE